MMMAEGSSWTLYEKGEVEPNTKLFLNEFGKEDLNQLERFCVQILPYKRDKGFMLKPAVDIQFRIDPVKFYKLHTFTDNDFKQYKVFWMIISIMKKIIFIDAKYVITFLNYFLILIKR